MKRSLLIFCASFCFVFYSHAQIQNYSVGQTVPDFTVTDIHGGTHTLYNYTSQGKWVLLDFYAYWCGPCCQTAPIIRNFYVKYGCNQGNVIVLGLEGDGTTAQTQTFETNCVNNPQTYPVCSGLDGGADPVHNTYNPAAYPTVCLIGPDNLMKNIDIWPINSVANIEAAFPNGVLTPMACLTSVNEENFDMQFALYPNPASDFITLAFSMNETKNIRYYITNMLGQNMLSGYLGDISYFNEMVDVSMLESGNYFVQIISNDKPVYHSKFTIIR
jgi:hypothetical protein